jgi:hypothetical protein
MNNEDLLLSRDHVQREVGEERRGEERGGMPLKMPRELVALMSI